MKIDTTHSAIACKKMICAKVDLKRMRLSTLSEQVSDTAYRVDYDLGVMLVELLADTMDVDFDSIRCHIARISKNLIFDQFFRHDAILAPHQELQYRRLAAGQQLWLFIDEHLPAFGVERQIAYLQRAPEQLARSAQ